MNPSNFPAKHFVRTAGALLAGVLSCLPLWVSAQTNPDSTVNLDVGLLGCYTFAGSAADHSGNKNDGVRHEIDLTTDRFNRTNNAFLFTGNNSITLPAMPIISSRTFSFSAWVYTNVNPLFGEAQFVFSMGDKNGFFGEILSRNYKQANLSGWGVAGWKDNVLLPGSDVNFVLPQTKTWYHLAMVISEDSTRYFINGIASRGLKTDAVPYFYNCTTCLITIGALPDGSLGYKGIIDDVSIHDRALTKAEVKELYRHGLPCVEIQADVSDVSLCGAKSCSLLASGGTAFRWYDQPVGGNLLFEGNPYVTPVLNTSTEFYTSVVVGDTESKRTKVSVSVFPEIELDCNFSNAGRHQDELHFAPIAAGGTAPFTWRYTLGDGSATETSSPEISHTFSAPGNYPVTITVTDANGCQQRCEHEIGMEYELFVPNIIIANNDTLNRELTIFFTQGGQRTPYEGSRRFSMTIFDRWGQQVFYTESPANGWTGQNNPAGVYFYSLSLGDEKRKGWVSLVR